MRFTVIRNKDIRSWPIHEHGGRGYVLDAGAALVRTYSTDAHLWPGPSPKGRRLSGGAVGRVPVFLQALVADFDCPEVHGTPAPVPDAWRRAEREKLHALNAEHRGVFAYDSRGGYRTVLALPEPVEICAPQDVEAWSRFYRIALAYLERRFGMVGDPSCCDWTRLYRLPRATRDPSVGPELRPTFGDASAIGVLEFDPTDEDVEKVDATVRKTSGKSYDFTAPSSVDRGLFFWLLYLRGDVGQESARGGWICRCPNRAQHSLNTDGSDTTVVYPARAGGEIGAISCKHGHCWQRFTAAQWLSFFSDDEKREARARAGIRSKGKAA